MAAGLPAGVRVGITGHRPNKLAAAALPRIERQLREVFAAIDAATTRDGRAGAVLTSGFAEGADQLAVAAAPAHWRVEAILPFPKDEYLKDFERSAAGDGRAVRSEFLASLARAASIRELPAQPGPRHLGYLAGGRAMLAQSDLLVAVWDGAPPEPGGTGQMVQEACARNIPVIWIASDAAREPELVERFDAGGPVASARPWTHALLGR